MGWTCICVVGWPLSVDQHSRTVVLGQPSTKKAGGGGGCYQRLSCGMRAPSGAQPSRLRLARTLSPRSSSDVQHNASSHSRGSIAERSINLRHRGVRFLPRLVQNLQTNRTCGDKFCFQKWEHCPCGMRMQISEHNCERERENWWGCVVSHPEVMAEVRRAMYVCMCVCVCVCASYMMCV